MNKEKETILKGNSDFSGLLDTCIAERGSLGGLGAKICKVSYYSGRLKTNDKLNLFIEKYKGLIIFHVNNEYKELADFLLKVGYLFPNLSDNDIKILEKYYCTPDYYDLMEDILFDQHLLLRKLEKFDMSIRNSHNTLFSDELLNDVFKASMYNDEAEDEKVFYYDKSQNKVVKANFNDSDVIHKVHYFIKLLKNFNEFANSVDDVLGDKIRQAFFEQHGKDILKDAPYEFILRAGFSQYYFDLFKTFVKDNRANFSLPTNPIDKLIKHISRKWLQKVNEN